jgi:hypothetical protein
LELVQLQQLQKLQQLQQLQQLQVDTHLVEAEGKMMKHEFCMACDWMDSSAKIEVVQYQQDLSQK